MARTRSTTGDTALFVAEAAGRAAFSLFFFGRVLAPNYIDFVLVLATAGLVLLLNPAVTLRRLPAHASENLVPAVAGVRPDP